MALWPIGERIGPMTWLYATCAANPGRGLCGDPPTREYCNRFTVAFGDWRSNFNLLYHSGGDCYVLYAIFDYEPWYIGYLVMNPETGQRIYDWEQSLGPLPAVIGGSLWDIMSAKCLEIGTLDKLFIVRSFFFSGSIYEVDPGNLKYNGGWGINCGDIPEYPSYWTLDGSDGVIVNLVDGYLAVAGTTMTREVMVWKGLPGAPIYHGEISLPYGQIHDTCYEDRKRMWLVTGDAYVIKINYQDVRVEFLSQLPYVEPDDRKYNIAWDAKRGRLCVMRQKYDDPVTGACQCTMEFYRPIGKSALLTDPVPVGTLRAGKQVPFVFHLMGTAGEPIAPYLVQANLTSPANGIISSGIARTGAGGMGTVEYTAPMVTGEDTINLQATIEDGE